MNGRGDATSGDSAATQPPSYPSSTALDTGVPVEPVVYWSLHGRLDLVDGEIDLVDSVLEIRSWTLDLDDRCSVLLPIVTASVSEPPSSETALYGWWTVAHDEAIPMDPTCPTWAAGTLDIGIGAYDVRLDAAMSARDWLAADLYSLYLSIDGSAIFVTGVAGTDALFAGNDQTVTAGPLPDALYDIESLVVLDL